MTTATVAKKKKKKRNIAAIKKLSTLLEVALGDLKKQEKAKNVVIDMGTWCRKDKDGVCHVCLAGSVMKGSLGLAPRKYNGIEPHQLSCGTEKRMRALNYLRVGCVTSAYLSVHDDYDDVAFENRVLSMNREVRDYHENRLGWWEDMHTLLADLRKAKL